MYDILLIYIPSSCKVLNTYKANTSKTTIYMTIHLPQLHCSSSTHPSLHLTVGASMSVDQSSSTQMEAKLFLFFVVLKLSRCGKHIWSRSIRTLALNLSCYILWVPYILLQFLMIMFIWDCYLRCCIKFQRISCVSLCQCRRYLHTCFHCFWPHNSLTRQE